MLSGLAVGLVEKKSDFKHGFSPYCGIFPKDLDKGLMR
jgi:hypothetical protein